MSIWFWTNALFFVCSIHIGANEKRPSPPIKRHHCHIKTRFSVRKINRPWRISGYAHHYWNIHLYFFIYSGWWRLCNSICFYTVRSQLRFEITVNANCALTLCLWMLIQPKIIRFKQSHFSLNRIQFFFFGLVWFLVWWQKSCIIHKCINLRNDSQKISQSNVRALRGNTKNPIYKWSVSLFVHCIWASSNRHKHTKKKDEEKKGIKMANGQNKYIAPFLFLVYDSICGLCPCAMIQCGCVHRCHSNVST